jgi:purine/pyrimidine-nucleoside phosphorylase
MFKVNEYFNGAVKSIAFNDDSRPATIGVMAKGDYEFGTSQKETMIIITGSLIATLPGSKKAKTYAAGQSFNVAANKRFKVKVNEDTSYLCYYE